MYYWLIGTLGAHLVPTIADYLFQLSRGPWFFFLTGFPLLSREKPWIMHRLWSECRLCAYQDKLETCLWFNLNYCSRVSPNLFLHGLCFSRHLMTFSEPSLYFINHSWAWLYLYYSLGSLLLLLLLAHWVGHGNFLDWWEKLGKNTIQLTTLSHYLTLVSSVFQKSLSRMWWFKKHHCLQLL